MSLASVTLTVTEATLALTASRPFALRELVPVTVSPASCASGASVLTLTRNGLPVAECDLTDGVGELDLSTAEAVDLFSGLPSGWRLAVRAELWSTDDDRLIASSNVKLVNVLESSRSSVRIAAAGELSMTLAAAMPAGTPVMRDDDGNAAACRASNAHRFIGVLRTGGEAAASARVVTAGLAAVTGWPVTGDTGLTPGLCYYLDHSADTLTATPPSGYNVRPVGIAIDAATLALLPSIPIQTAADGTPHYLAYEQAGRRLMAVSPVAASLGAASANAIPMLGASGLLDASMLPDQTAASVAAVRALFAAFAPLEDPAYDDLVSAINSLIAILKGA